MIESPQRKSVTDSPWYWVYLFAAAGLIAILLLGPKYAARQAQIEEKFQARERARQQARGEEPDVQLSTPDNLLITLRPLLILLAVVFVVASGVLWWQHFRPRRRPDPNPPTTAKDGA